MSGYFFDGQLHVTPAVLSRVDDSAMLNRGASVGQVAAFIGKAASGQPNTVLTFGSPDEARKALFSGDLLDCVVRAFNPSSETGAPQSVVAVRVDPAVRASLDLRDSLASVVVNLTTQGYGQRENQVKVKVEAATGGRGLKLTTQRGNEFYSADNVFRNAFKVRYSGGQASAVMTLNGTQCVLQAPSGSTVATLTFATFPTVQELVDAISSVNGFAASVQDGNGNMPTTQAFDTVTAQDVKTADYVARADLQAVIDWFNSAGEGFVIAARPTDVGTLPAALPFTYFTGGSNGTVTNSEWQNGYTALQTADVQWVVPASTDPAIHAMNVAHCAFMSTVGQKERRGAVGCPLGTSDATALTLAKAINDDRTSFFHLGGYDFDANGVRTLYAPFVVAAMYAAAFCGVSPGTPITNKSLRLLGLERKLRVPTDTDALILGGVVPIDDGATGVRVIKSISTWLNDSKFNRVEQSVGIALDYTVRTWRNALATLKGGKNSPQALSLALEISKTTLSDLAVPESSGGPGILVGDANSPPFANLSAKIDGDVIAVTGQVSPAIPTNFVSITVFAKPFSGSASLAA